MTKDQKHSPSTGAASLSEFQIALNNFKLNRFAVVCVVILCLLYGSAIFADFLSPYSFKNEERNYSYCPPTSVKFMDKGALTRPYIHGVKLTFDEYYKRVYIVDTDKKYSIRFFVKGDEYKLLGLIPPARISPK